MMAEARGFEPLRPLSDLAVFKTAPFNHSGTPPDDGDPGRNRTCNLLDRNQTLYPLSYEAM